MPHSSGIRPQELSGRNETIGLGFAVCADQLQSSTFDRQFDCTYTCTFHPTEETTDSKYHTIVVNTRCLRRSGRNDYLGILFCQLSAEVLGSTPSARTAGLMRFCQRISVAFP